MWGLCHRKVKALTFINNDRTSEKNASCYHDQLTGKVANTTAHKATEEIGTVVHDQSPLTKINFFTDDSRFFSSFLALAWLPWDCWFEDEVTLSCPFDAFCSCFFTTGTSEMSFSSIPMSRICCSRFSAADKCWIGADRAFTKSVKKRPVK